MHCMPFDNGLMLYYDLTPELTSSHLQYKTFLNVFYFVNFLFIVLLIFHYYA